MIAVARTPLAAIGDMFRRLLRHRRLTWELTKREVSDRYAGQLFGSLWAIGHPLALMGVYIFMFAYVLKLKIGGTREVPLDYTTYLLSGLIPWLTFQEAMSKGVGSITSNANLVKQVVFPLEVLPLKGIFAAMFTQLITTTLLVTYVCVSHRYLPWTFMLLPLLWCFQLMAMAGVCYLLAAVGAYFRDLKEFVQVFTVMGLYLIPAFYLPAWVPTLLKPVLYLNPFSYMIWCYQDLCYFGRFEHLWAWPVFGLGSLLAFYLGYRAFSQLKHGFGSVL